MTDFWPNVPTEKATKQAVLVLDQRTYVPRVNESEAIEIESNNMSKDLAATTNETSLTTTPNNSAQDRNTETNQTENKILFGLYCKRALSQVKTNEINKLKKQGKNQKISG